MSGALLVEVLRDPAAAYALDRDRWTSLLCAARAERLLGSLAWRLAGRDVPAAIEARLAVMREAAAQDQVAGLWEAEMARRALASLGVVPILLKGTAYAAAGLDAGQGRVLGDLDILVPAARLAEVEAELLGAGWGWVKDDSYDQLYYRRWMHELPPLIHAERDRMIDVHHTILPLTATPRPDADRLIADAVPLGSGGLATLAPADMLLHAVAHLAADGDLSGGLRTLWDIDRLWRQFDAPGFAETVEARARLHGLAPHLRRSARLARDIFATPIGPAVGGRRRAGDALYRRRLLARDGWARETRAATRLGFYARSHLIRMPPHLLARHLWTKWRRGP